MITNLTDVATHSDSTGSVNQKSDGGPSALKRVSGLLQEAQVCQDIAGDGRNIS